MEVDYGSHFLLMLWAFITGGALGAVYGLFRFFHLYTKNNFITVFFGDLLFCFICACAQMLLFFNLSFGIMRLYAFAFSGLGFVLERITLGKLVSRMQKKLIELLKPPLRLIKLKIITYIKMKRLICLAGRGFGR